MMTLFLFSYILIIEYTLMMKGGFVMGKNHSLNINDFLHGSGIHKNSEYPVLIQTISSRKQARSYHLISCFPLRTKL